MNTTQAPESQADTAFADVHSSEQLRRLDFWDGLPTGYLVGLYRWPDDPEGWYRHTWPGWLEHRRVHGPAHRRFDALVMRVAASSKRFAGDVEVTEVAPLAPVPGLKFFELNTKKALSAILITFARMGTGAHEKHVLLPDVCHLLSEGCAAAAGAGNPESLVDVYRRKDLYVYACGPTL